MPSKSGRSSSVSGTPIARNFSTEDTEVGQRTSSTESIADSDVVWDTSPLGLREPPSSPTTPPEDEESGDEEIESSPLKSYPRSVRAARPPLKTNLRAYNPRIKRKRARKPTEDNPIGNGDSLDRILNTVHRPQAGINSLDSGSGERESHKSYDAEDIFKKEHKIEDAQLIPYFPMLVDELKLGSKNADTHTNDTENGTQVVDALQSTRHFHAGRRRENENLCMPGGWHQDFETSCSNMIPSKPHKSADSIKMNWSATSLFRPESFQEVVDKPTHGPLWEHDQKHLVANDISTGESSPQAEEISKERESINPDPPLFIPYYKGSIDPNRMLYHLFGGKNVKQANKVKRKSKNMSETSLDDEYSSLRGLNPYHNASLGEGLGCIYMFEMSDCPGFIKIGMTTQLVENRVKEWNYKCGQVFKIIDDPHDKDFYNFDVVEKIIHIELWSKRRTFKCGKCTASHRFKLPGTTSLAKTPTVSYKGPVSHGEWFEISREEALMAISKWRRWMSPDRKPYSSLNACKMWHHVLQMITTNFVQFVMNEIFSASPYGRDGRIRGCWVRRFHDLAELDNRTWEKWREAPSWVDIGLELIDFTTEKMGINHRRACTFGFSAQKAIKANEELFIDGIAFVSSMALIVFASVLCRILGIAGGLIAGFFLLFCYFTIRWFFERKYMSNRT